MVNLLTMEPVSYTHLDVYKRQFPQSLIELIVSLKTPLIIIMLLTLMASVEASEDNTFYEQLKVGGFSSAAITLHRDAEAEAAINELSLSLIHI